MLLLLNQTNKVGGVVSSAPPIHFSKPNSIVLKIFLMFLILLLNFYLGYLFYLFIFRKILIYTTTCIVHYFQFEIFHIINSFLRNCYNMASLHYKII